MSNVMHKNTYIDNLSRDLRYFEILDEGGKACARGLPKMPPPHLSEDEEWAWCTGYDMACDDEDYRDAIVNGLARQAPQGAEA